MPFLDRPSQNLPIITLDKQSLNGTEYEEFSIGYFRPNVPVPAVAKLTIPGVCTDYRFTANDLINEGELGHGNFAFVQKMRHRKLDCSMAVKIVRSVLNEREKNKSLKDLHIIMKSKFERIVTFYGAIFHESECWICMELMDSSLDKFYKTVYLERKSFIPEAVLAMITVAVVSALNYLKCELHVMHRDVKPSNVLINKGGDVKLCDFGISGDLVNSLAMTKDVGCRPYMAPERINPDLMSHGYDVRSDVWSLGISLVELATGRFPYPSWRSPFHQLQSVLQSPSPQLPPDEEVSVPFSAAMREFVDACLQKDLKKRPKYAALMELPWYVEATPSRVELGAYFTSILESASEPAPQ
ncbi:Dual specificity mitogen-activated protein kinase kinase 4 [Taenia solium]|eukprot:TsM_001144400 transcript=TsM_001144400 gene=TsM_001144400